MLSMLQNRFFGNGDLSKRIGAAGSWTVINFGANNLLRLISNLVLTRLLSPEIFGLMALAQVFMGGITMLSDVGVKASVVRSERGEDTAFLETAWSVQIIRGTIVTCLCCLIAWPASVAYDQPILFPLLCALSLTAFFSGFRSVSIAVANRNLMAKQLFFMGIIDKVLKVGITIFIAWWLQSVWALVIAAVIGTIIQVGLSHTMLPRIARRPALDRDALREIISFGRWILLATFFTYLGGRGQQALYGFVVTVEVIGLISIATLLANLPVQLFNSLIGAVLFPSFSKILRERPQDLPRALRKARLFVIGLAFPILFGVAFLAQPIVDLLYDDRYQAAGLILTFSALNGATPLLTNTYQNLLLAEGRSGVHAQLMFIWATTTMLGIFLGFSTFGLIGALTGVAIATSIMFFINLAIAIRRGYASGLLDLFAYSIIVAVYLVALFGIDHPEAFTSPNLAGQISFTGQP